MIRLHIAIPEETYQKAKQVARGRGISLAELCRRGLEEMIAGEPAGKPSMA